MKVYITIFGLMALFYLGIHPATAQEPSKKEVAKTDYQKLNAADIAKMQTQNLQELVKLDDAQALKVYEVLLKVEQKMEAITENGASEVTKMAEINKWETLKTEKLKEILTAEQFSSYMITVKSNKR